MSTIGAVNETDSLADLFRAVTRDLKRYLIARLRNPDDADDATQEAFLRVWKRGQAQTMKNPRSFVFSVAGNIAIDRLRERRRWQWSDEATGVETPDILTPDRVLSAREELLLVTLAIKRLPPKCAQALRLRLDGASHAEIAGAMRISKSMVEKHLATALARLDKARTSRLPTQIR